MGHLFFSFLLAALPALLFVGYYYGQDPHPEHKGLMIKIFLLGFLLTFPIYVIEILVSLSNAFRYGSPLLSYFFEAFVVAGLCEEYFKLTIIRNFVYHHPQFNEVMDGIIYTITASLGFACMENILYVVDGGWQIAVARGVTAVPMHALCSGMMGFYVGKAKFVGNKKLENRLINKGLWTAILVHGCYDFLLFISPWVGVIFSAVIALLIGWAFLNLKERIREAVTDDRRAGR